MRGMMLGIHFLSLLLCKLRRSTHHINKKDTVNSPHHTPQGLTEILGANIWLADTIKALSRANTTVLISMELREDKVPLVKEFFIMLRDDFNLKLVEVMVIFPSASIA